MNIVIAGAGKFGKELTENLSKLKHNVTIIDNTQKIPTITLIAVIIGFFFCGLFTIWCPHDGQYVTASFGNSSLQFSQRISFFS